MVEELKEHVGKLFIRSRYGEKLPAILEEVRKDKVILRHPERKDSYSLPIGRFHKFFKLT